MAILFVLGILLGAVAVIFALQNTAVITVAFFYWQITGSLAVILIAALWAGIVVTLLILLPGSIGNYFKYRKLQKAIVRIEEELRKQKELTVFAKNTPASAETIDQIEHGAIIQQ